MALFQIISDLLWDSYEVMIGDQVLRRRADTFQYSNADGYVVTVTGSAFTYDAQGIPTGGTLTGIIVKLGDVLLSDFTGLQFSLAQFNTLTFGTTSGSATIVDPDIEALFVGLRAGDDEIFGNAQGRNILGYAGNDTIHGGGGDDWLVGGAGTDLYFGDDGRDGVTFGAPGQTAHGVVIDMTRITGNIQDDGFGNVETANGIEDYEGSAFGDRMTGNGDDQNFWGLDGKDRLTGGGGNDHLYGGGGADTLLGGGGLDILEGGAGKDSYNGGRGLDFVVFWNVDDTGHGVTVDMALASGQVLDDGYGNVETMTSIIGTGGSEWADMLSGNLEGNELGGNGGDDTLTGRDGDDSIWAGDGADKVYGGNGADDIYGEAGQDTLSGGAGADEFAFFGTETGFDKITDFSQGSDLITFRAGWGQGLVGGNLGSGQFRAAAGATSAVTTGQRVIYDTTTHSLYFDADGVGGEASVKFAVLTNGSSLTAADFWIFT